MRPPLVELGLAGIVAAVGCAPGGPNAEPKPIVTPGELPSATAIVFESPTAFRSPVRPTETPAPTRVVPTAPPADTPRPTATPSKTGEKVAIRLKPEELFRGMRIAQFQPNELPFGYYLIGKSSGDLEETDQAFKAIGKVNVLLAAPSYSIPGVIMGPTTFEFISYTIFPDASRGQAAYDRSTKMRPNNLTLTDFAYPATYLVELSPGNVKNNICIVLVDNTFIKATVSSPTQDLQRERMIQLAQIGIKHLQRVGG